MKFVSEASESILTILKKFQKQGPCTRWLQYCVETPVDDGVLVFNLLTRELILLTNEEYASFTELDYLREHWFAVPEKTKDKELADFVKWLLAARQPKSKEITGYTIFTTTDCNARCFYCFELGRSRIPMSCETAEKVVQYIKNHCGGKKVSLAWFGGEPLFNAEVIDVISQGLRREGIEFRSKMVSNGYLFDDELVQKAVELWNLKRVQITLDGTEKVYNKTKAFIYRDTNPYEIVLNNIGRLLKADIQVSIRLNMDLHNADDLLTLSQELAERFSGRKGFSVYAHHLFDASKPMAELHKDDEWEKRETAMRRLADCFTKHGLQKKNGIRKNIKLNHCMADSGKSVTILPDGSIGLCEHFTESEFIGHIDQEGFDAEMVASWKEQMPEIPECAGCFYYLDCVKLKKCSTSSVCYQGFRDERLKSTQRAMLCEYEHWLTNTNTAEDEDTGFC